MYSDYATSAPYGGMNPPSDQEYLFSKMLAGIGPHEKLYGDNLKLLGEVKALKARIRELEDTITQMDKPTPLQGYEAGPR